MKDIFSFLYWLIVSFVKEHAYLLCYRLVNENEYQ